MRQPLLQSQLSPVGLCPSLECGSLSCLCWTGPPPPVGEDGGGREREREGDGGWRAGEGDREKKGGQCQGVWLEEGLTK